MRKILPAAAIVALAAFAGLWLARHRPPPADPSAPAVLYWYDPMKPQAHFDRPGKSPFMDMELVPKYAAAGDGRAWVSIDPRVVQNLGMRTAPVVRGNFERRIEAVGAVELDQSRIFTIESRAPGWVEQLDVRAVGEPVQRGAQVAGVYAPELYSAQQELVLAAQSGDAGLLDAARQRLALLGASPGQIRRVLDARQAERRLRIDAPSTGVVTELNVREGGQVGPGMPLMKIADLSRVWIIVEIPEAQAQWAAVGSGAQARLAALPGRTFAGRVSYVYPQLDATTRTVRARLVFDNPDGALKPGMYAGVSVIGNGTQDALLVPSEAVIRTAARSAVIVADGEGRFHPVDVQLGAERAGQSVILRGLEQGQQVVTSGQFLIDSEASLQGAYNRMDGDAAAGANAAPP